MRAGLIRISTIVVAVAFGCDLFDGSRGTSNSKPSPEGAPPQTRPSASAGAHSSPKPHDGKPEWERLADGWDHPDPIPNFELTNQEGKKFRLGELADRHVMVGFIFTNCSVPKACPLTMQKMRAVQRLWGEREKAGETRGRRLHLLSFTFDPENDTPRVLKRYGETHEADFRSWTLATGPAGLMDDGLPSLFGVLALPSAKYRIAHTVKAALLGPGLVSIEEWQDNAFEPEHVVELVLGKEKRPQDR